VGVDISFILGIAKVKGQVIMLLDVDQVVGPEVDVSGLSVA
jgi:chemotaxis signal transduction protein